MKCSVQKSIFPILRTEFVAFLCSFALILHGCGGDSSRTQTTQNIAIEFAARAGDVEVRCNSAMTNLGVDRSTAILKDFRFYVSDIEVIDENGESNPVTLDINEWQRSNLALLDFQDRADNCEGDPKPTNRLLRGTIGSDVSWKSLRFHIGIPQNLNHIDLAQSEGPLRSTSMFWSWQSGYKFMRLDIAPEGGIIRPTDPHFSASVYSFHLGSTNCSGSPELGQPVVCQRSNRPLIELSGFQSSSSKVVIDYGKLVDKLTLRSDAMDTPGCMSDISDSECSVFFDSLGLDFKTGLVASSSQQRIFSVE